MSQFKLWLQLKLCFEIVTTDTNIRIEVYRVSVAGSNLHIWLIEWDYVPNICVIWRGPS